MTGSEIYNAGVQAAHKVAASEMANASQGIIGYIALQLKPILEQLEQIEQRLKTIETKKKWF